MKKRLDSFARRLLSEWKRQGLPLADEQVLVAVSGGADSVALLLALDQLRREGRLMLKITVAHLNHGLRGEAGREDALFVAGLASQLGYDLAFEECRVEELARARKDNLEQAARRARYQFLLAAAEERKAHAVLTAHTMDDQAETVLLRLMRGSGLDGLGGMEPVRALSAESKVLLARPLLRWARRAETVACCRSLGVDFRQDAMNEDEAFARVRVRKQLLPLMQSFNGRIVEALTRASQLLREDGAALQSAAATLLAEAAVEKQPALSVSVLSGVAASIRRRALRQWLARMRGDTRRLEMVHLVEVEKLVFGTRGGRTVELPGGGRVERRRGELIFYPAQE